MRCTVSKTVFIFEKIAGTTDFGARWDLIVHHMRSQEGSFASEGQSDGRDARCTLHAARCTLHAAGKLDFALSQRARGSSPINSNQQTIGTCSDSDDPSIIASLPPHGRQRAGRLRYLPWK